MAIVELENEQGEFLSASPGRRRAGTAAEFFASARSFADEVAGRPNRGAIEAPMADLQRMFELGMMTAPLPEGYGGMGLGTEAGAHADLLRLLAAIGGADLVLGRLYEGHVNALILIARFGTTKQLAEAAEDARRGMLFGVWNTGEPEPLRLVRESDRLLYRGVKAFASGAEFVRRPIVTAELPDRGGWQMTMPRMEGSAVAGTLVFDRQFWHPLGMEGSESYRVDFSGAAIEPAHLLGAPGDFYRDPLFRGGAIRFAAVHAGAILRLHRLFAEWLGKKGRGEDPYQIARLGDLSLLAQEAVLWIERAAAVAEEGLSPGADKLSCERIVEFANMTRLAVERAATAAMQLTIAGVGAHGLLQPSPFERIVRNLTMYLRQPAPDHTRAEVGRAALRKSHLRADGAGNGMWNESRQEGSLPPSYFRGIYERNADPWNFQKSGYEAEKYKATLESLPRPRYRHAFEVGSSIGVFTEQLAARCEELLSVDVSEQALAAARERCAALPEVRFARMQLPGEMPEGRFDLIVMSEVAYYWTREDLEAAIDGLAERHETGGHLILVHHTDTVPDYPLTGDQVHEAWLARGEWKLLDSRRAKGYRLDVLERRGRGR